MSTAPSGLSAAAPAAAAAPAKPLTAIQVIEQEIFGYFKQKEQMIANVHAIDGAIQSGQALLAKLKAEEAKGEAWAKAEAEKVEAEAKKVAGEVEAELKKL